MTDNVKDNPVEKREALLADRLRLHNPSWLSCEDETQRCIMVEIYLEP